MKIKATRPMWITLCLIVAQLINSCSSIQIEGNNANSIQICTCQDEVSYDIVIPETATGKIELDKAFVVRGLNSNSTYTIGFGPNTSLIVFNALEILPSGESLGVTEISIVVKDSDFLDFDGNDGFWWDTFWAEVVPVTQFFDIIVTEVDSGNTATASIKLTVYDVNDIAPTFLGVDPEKNEYNILVCENMEKGTLLRVVEIESLKNPICPETTDGPLVQIISTDSDISFMYSVVRYRWASDSEAPPITMETDGTMRVNSDVNFDFEKNQEETYILEAYDNPYESSNQQITQISVRFTILDKSD